LDPVGDRSAEVLPGLLRKYHGRALLIASGACAIHCRYCFRRHFPYALAPHSIDQWQPAIDYIAQDDSLDEVILSGGDPLMLVDSSLTWMIRQLDKIPHLRRIRIHSRFPVVIPQRVSPAMLDWIRDSRCAIYFVLHINHVAEIDEFLAQSLSQLRLAGVTLLNQSVLLRGINDTPEAQRELCLRLCDLQVLPYYLHQLDRVQGAMHFQVPDSQATQIVEHLREVLPGYAVPRLVREVAGQAYKVPLELENNSR
jgi:EF-P beta-lysylation protein EpmB